MGNTTSQPPKGFSIVGHCADEWTICYKCTGMGCLHFFLIICVVGLGTGLAYVEVSVPGAIRWLIFADWWTPVAFVACVSAIVYSSCFVLFQLFGTTTFHVSGQGITIRRHLFGFSRTRYLPRDELQYLEQIKDGGEGEDSFPSWGLRLIGRRKVSLLSRAPIDKSDWLGQFLAQQLDLEYRPTDRRRSVEGK